MQVIKLTYFPMFIPNPLCLEGIPSRQQFIENTFLKRWDRGSNQRVRAHSSDSKGRTSPQNVQEGRRSKLRIIQIDDMRYNSNITVILSNKLAFSARNIDSNGQYLYIIERLGPFLPLPRKPPESECHYHQKVRVINFRPTPSKFSKITHFLISRSLWWRHHQPHHHPTSSRNLAMERPECLSS